MNVSIVLPVYNGEETLSLCLDSLINLDFPKDKLEIIVVDNNSTDTTKEIIKQYPVKYVFESKRSRGAARNKGIRESRGELIAFTDADCIADRGWLMNLIKGFDSEVVVGCGGECISFTPSTLIEKYYDFKNLFSQKRGLMAILPRIATFNAVYRRYVLEEVGLFDESFITNEDVDLSWRVYLKGYQLKYIPEAIVSHKHPDRLTEFFRKYFEYGYTNTYFRQKYINLFNGPSLGYNDYVAFSFKLLQSAAVFFTFLFTENDVLRKVSPILDIIVKDLAVLLGRTYGLLRIRLGMENFSPPYPIPENRVLWRIVDGKVVILELKRDSYYVLNDVGTKVWTLAVEGKNISEIIDIIADEYNVDKEKIKKDIINFIDELKRENILDKLPYLAPLFIAG